MTVPVPVFLVLTVARFGFTADVNTLRQIVGSDTTLYAAISKFEGPLAEMVKDIDFFDSPELNPVIWSLKNLDYDEDNKILILSAVYSSPIAIIDTFLSLEDIRVEIRLGTDAGDIFEIDSSLDLSLESYVVFGSWTVGSVSFDLSVTKDDDTLFVEGATNPPTVSVDSFFSALGDENFLPRDMASVLSTNAGLDRFSLEETRARVLYSSSSGYAVSLSGFPTVAGWGSSSMEVILQRNAGSEKSVFVIAVSFSSFSLASLVQQLTGIDISGIPVIGSLTLHETKLFIATDDPSNLLLDEDDMIKKGVSLSTSFSLESGNPLAYVINLSKDKAIFELADELTFSGTVQGLFDALVPGFESSTISLPPGVPDIFKTAFKDYYYSSDTKSIGVTIELEDDIDLVPGVVTVSNPYITVTATITHPRKVSVSGDAEWTLGNQDFAITIEEVDDGDGYVVRGQGSALNMGKILSQFGAVFLPNELSSVLRSSGLDKFKISSPTVQIPLGSASKDFEMVLAGEPVIGGWSGVTLNTIILDTEGTDTAVISGFEFVDTNFAGLIKSLTGVSVSIISLLDRSLQSAIVISARTVDNVHLTGTLLSQLPVKKGVSVIAAFSFPDHCKTDLLCKFCKSAMGDDASLQLRSTIISATDFVIAAASSDITLGKGLTLSNAALEFQVGTEISAGVSATLDLKNPDLTFIGAVRVGVQGLELSMKMEGIWENAFSTSWLSFGNIIISMAVKPGIPLPGLELGAEVQIGSETDQKLMGQAYLGFDPVLPDNNYYYASINKASIQAILNAFGMSASLPRPLVESGFPKGLSSSFSLTEQEPVPGVIIPAGFRLNGTINIIGYEVSADISLNPPSEFTIDMSMDPINLANGLFKLYRAKNEPRKGPRFYASIKTSPPSVTLKADGYARVLSTVEQEASLEITNTQYVMTVSGPLFGLEATLRVYASYGSLKSAAFQVYGLLSSEWIQEISAKVQNEIKNGADKATKAINDAQKDVDNAKKKFDSANDDLESAERAVKKVCKQKRCRKVTQCVGCTKPKCCKKKWGKCIVPCVKWDNCCTKAKVTDPTCETYNAGCAAAKGTALESLDAAQASVNAAKKSLNSANAILASTKKAYKAGSDAAAAIARMGLGGLINIEKIEFDVEIAMASTGRFSGTIKASFLKKSQSFNFHLRLKSISSMAKDLAEKAFKGITK
jgi:hypothetical protein